MKAHSASARATGLPVLPHTSHWSNSTCMRRPLSVHLQRSESASPSSTSRAAGSSSAFRTRPTTTCTPSACRAASAAGPPSAAERWRSKYLNAACSERRPWPLTSSACSRRTREPNPPPMSAVPAADSGTSPLRMPVGDSSAMATGRAKTPGHGALLPARVLKLKRARVHETSCCPSASRTSCICKRSASCRSRPRSAERTLISSPRRAAALYLIESMASSCRRRAASRKSVAHLSMPTSERAARSIQRA
mmetsp:Transcript_21801/g.50128  ORF Transcript_21801/g.50128 Transcript_21801/m.50128 type:complete len:250 (+) Transcript_21801:235-984(+)